MGIKEISESFYRSIFKGVPDMARIKKVEQHIENELRREPLFPCSLFTGDPEVIQSHSVPESVLRNLVVSDGDRLFNIWHLLGMEDRMPGAVHVKDAGTFRLLGKDEDQALFEHYENDALERLVKERKAPDLLLMLNEIWLKTLLKKIFDCCIYQGKIYKEIHAAQEVCQKSSKSKGTPSQDPWQKFYKQNENKLTLSAAMAPFSRQNEQISYDGMHYMAALRTLILRSGTGSLSMQDIELLYFKVIPWRVPYAVQDMFPLYYDFDGIPISDFIMTDVLTRKLLYSDNFISNELNACVFPLRESSLVLLFVLRDCPRFELLKGVGQYLRDHPQEADNLVNFLIWLNSDQIWYSPVMEELPAVKPRLSALREIANERMELRPTQSEKFRSVLEYCRLCNIPNLLSRECALIC